MTSRVCLLFSADYELFFGQNYFSEYKVLIEPTDQLLKACTAADIPVTLFADVASVWRYRSLHLDSDYPRRFEAQLCESIGGIHDVQLHLHPHWMTCEFDGKKWRMDERRYLLSGVGYGPRPDSGLEGAETLIHKGKGYLEALLRRVDASYNCIAFRAGGYGIQPNDREFFGALESTGFEIDSSIVPGMVFRSNVNQIDFSRVPTRANVRFSSRNGLAKEDKQGIFEIPVVACRRSFPYLLGFALRRICRSKGEFRHRGCSIQKLTRMDFIKTVLRQVLHPVSELELSGFINVDYCVKSTDAFIRKHLEDSSTIYLALSCHPKSVFPETIDGILTFWDRMVSIYGSEIKAITFREAARRLTRQRCID